MYMYTYYSQTPSTNIHVHVYRWLKSFKVSFASEGKQRAMAKSLIDDNIHSEMGVFTALKDGGCKEIVKAPFVCVPSLIAKVSDTLTLNSK